MTLRDEVEATRQLAQRLRESLPIRYTMASACLGLVVAQLEEVLGRHPANSVAPEDRCEALHPDKATRCIYLRGHGVAHYDGRFSPWRERDKDAAKVPEHPEVGERTRAEKEPERCGWRTAGHPGVCTLRAGHRGLHSMAHEEPTP